LYEELYEGLYNKVLSPRTAASTFPASLIPSAALISAFAALKKLPAHHKRARAP
jgi:hypothetical protein